MPPESDENARHKAKMANRKAIQDAEVAEKTVEKGLLIVHTGKGKGKSTAAFGLMLRALGRGFRCGVVQFGKGAWQSGERAAIEKFGDQIEWHTLGEGFTWETQDRARDVAAAERAQHQPEGRRRLALALAGMDDQQAFFDCLAGDLLVLRSLAVGHFGLVPGFFVVCCCHVGTMLGKALVIKARAPYQTVDGSPQGDQKGTRCAHVGALIRGCPRNCSRRAYGHAPLET